MLGMVFRLPLRQTEGFVRSLVDLMGYDLPVPDHTTLSRRRRTVDVVVETSTNKWPTDIVLVSTGLKFFGAGEWARAKHGETRRSWRKLHISVDPASSEIRTHELTGDDTADATMAGPLVAGSGGMIRRVFADGAYDGVPVTKAIREARPPNSPPEIIIPPRATSIPPPDTVPSIYSIVPPNDGSAFRHGHHFEPVDFVIDHGRGHHNAFSAGSCQRTYARACGCRQRQRRHRETLIKSERGWSGREAFVTMMQTADLGQGNDRSGPGRLNGSSIRCVLADRQVGP